MPADRLIQLIESKSTYSETMHEYMRCRQEGVLPTLDSQQWNYCLQAERDWILALGRRPGELPKPVSAG